jgi:hypothetical protein
MYSFINYNGLLINENFLGFLKEINLADFRILKNFENSAPVKKTKYRSVVRIIAQDRTFYLKRHFWPLKERLISLIPWIRKEDAMNEWENMILLNELGINTMVPVAFGEEKILGIPFFSLTMTENLFETEKMKPYLQQCFAQPVSIDMISEKRRIIRKLASFARDFHNKGLNHQDFNLGHLYFRPKDDMIFITDIQRSHQRKAISVHDRIKDLAQLSYSAMRTNVFSRADFMRFAHEYFLQQRMGKEEKRIIRGILAKMTRIARHDSKVRSKRKKNRARQQLPAL